VRAGVYVSLVTRRYLRVVTRGKRREKRAGNVRRNARETSGRTLGANSPSNHRNSRCERIDFR